MEEWGYSVTILDLPTRWRWMINSTSRPLILGERRYPLDRRLSRSQSRSGRCGAEKDSCLSQESKLGRPARSPSLYRLRYKHKTDIMYLARVTLKARCDTTSQFVFHCHMYYFVLCFHHHSVNRGSQSFVIFWGSQGFYDFLVGDYFIAFEDLKL
jgi:hypothetical protein